MLTSLITLIRIFSKWSCRSITLNSIGLFTQSFSEFKRIMGMVSVMKLKAKGCGTFLDCLPFSKYHQLLREGRQHITQDIHSSWLPERNIKSNKSEILHKTPSMDGYAQFGFFLWIHFFSVQNERKTLLMVRGPKSDDRFPDFGDKVWLRTGSKRLFLLPTHFVNISHEKLLLMVWLWVCGRFLRASSISSSKRNGPLSTQV